MGFLVYFGPSRYPYKEETKAIILKMLKNCLKLSKSVPLIIWGLKKECSSYILYSDYMEDSSIM